MNESYEHYAGEKRIYELSDLIETFYIHAQVELLDLPLELDYYEGMLSLGAEYSPRTKQFLKEKGISLPALIDSSEKCKSILNERLDKKRRAKDIRISRAKEFLKHLNEYRNGNSTDLYPIKDDIITSIIDDRYHNWDSFEYYNKKFERRSKLFRGICLGSVLTSSLLYYVVESPLIASSFAIIGSLSCFYSLIKLRQYMKKEKSAKLLLESRDKEISLVNTATEKDFDVAFKRLIYYKKLENLSSLV